MSTQTTLNLTSPEAEGPVECLGHTFPSDAARREHYLGLLAEKLQDPEFRKIEGFPIGEDEDILALSDPPYYTACPNPWIAEFITHYGRPYDPKETYHREPFAADVSEGKNHPIYNAHSYHTKVPHRAIMRYLLHYTEPGDVVFDGFCGTGMTGVAAQLCGDRNEVQALGYRVDAKGVIFDESGKEVSKLGSRRSLLNDLSPAASFIAATYNSSTAPDRFTDEATAILQEISKEFGWMYETTHTGSETTGRINFTVWSDVFSCAQCGGEVIFWEDAVEEGEVKDEISCPSCGAVSSKRALNRKFETVIDPARGTPIQKAKRKPVLINYSIGGARHTKVPDKRDLEVLARIESTPITNWIPTVEINHDSDLWLERDYKSLGIYSADQFYTKRSLLMCAFAKNAIWRRDPEIRQALWFWFNSVLMGFSLVNRYLKNAFSQVNRILSGTLYVGGMQSEVSPWYSLSGKVSRLGKLFVERERTSLISTSSAACLSVPDASLDYVFLDPPFGSNIIYSDLSFIWEAWLSLATNLDAEAVVHRRKKHGALSLDEYSHLMRDCFKRVHAALKPGRWMTVEFSNTRASVWNAIQSALQEAGFVVANVAALDKQMGSFKAVTTTTAVKQDLVISAYKPNGGLEERFEKTGHTPEGVWDFMKTHLRNLPVVKPRGGELEFIAERDPRILYDRMVAFYVGHGVPVPLSSAEFQAGLAEKFPEREGMAFLGEQVAEFDKKRAQMQGVGQMTIFVEDERSAIDWLRNFLKSRPSVTSDITPEFMQQLGASWKKFETRPELALLLEQNFLQYRGNGEVPAQIHSYLSTQNKDLRNLPKDDARLRSRAKDRWFVPDPAKAVDVESIRNKRLLQEFRQLCDEAGVQLPSPGVTNQAQLPLVLPAAKKTARKKLKEVRTEAVRLGFKECFAAKDYATILALAAHLPNNVIEEDEQLQMIFDMAEMRAGV